MILLRISSPAPCLSRYSRSISVLCHHLVNQKNKKIKIPPATAETSTVQFKYCNYVWVVCKRDCFLQAEDPWQSSEHLNSTFQRWIRFERLQLCLWKCNPFPSKKLTFLENINFTRWVALWGEFSLGVNWFPSEVRHCTFSPMSSHTATWIVYTGH